MSFFEDVANGKRSIYDLDGWDMLVPAIVDEWIDFIRGVAG
jgi:hypothetical protein